MGFRIIEWSIYPSKHNFSLTSMYMYILRILLSMARLLIYMYMYILRILLSMARLLIYMYISILRILLDMAKLLINMYMYILRILLGMARLLIYMYIDYLHVHIYTQGFTWHGKITYPRANVCYKISQKRHYCNSKI